MTSLAYIYFIYLKIFSMQANLKSRKNVVKYMTSIHKVKSKYALQTDRLCFDLF